MQLINGAAVAGLVGEYPAVVAVALVLLVLVVVRAGRGRQRVQKDPQRAFNASERERIHARAGRQCEHKTWWLPRCGRAGTQADHVVPHSRGGATSVANGQSLCARHNRSKSARMPSVFYVWRLERRRQGYFPAGERVDVIWQQPSRV